MGKSKIDWCDKVWNPVTGCAKVSEGCRNCYAERMSKRLAGRCGYPEDGFKVTLHPDKLDEPLRWRKPSRVFVCSMGDLFHEDVVLSGFVSRVFAVMAVCPEHTFLILTRRPGLMYKFMKPGRGQIVNQVGCEEGFWGNMGIWPLPNVYLGVSVEDQQTADERIPLLLQTPAAKRFVSYEPAIEGVNFEPFLEGTCLRCYGTGEMSVSDKCPFCNGTGEGYKLDQIIMGAETSHGARNMNPQWARDTLAQCRAAGIPFFMKKMSGGQPIPEDLMVREFPNG